MAPNVEESVYATLLKLRLIRARRLLSTTEKPIKEIALECGFCHAQHLSNFLRRHLSMSPGEYREHERQSRDAQTSVAVATVK